LLFCQVWYLGTNVVVYTEMFELLTISVFEKVGLVVVVFMGYVLVIY
jgi:hypothetical protein